MTYSCTDFADSILDALKIELDDDEMDSPSDQADHALVEIERLQRIESQLKYAILVFSDTADRDLFIDRVHEIAEEKARTL